MLHHWVTCCILHIFWFYKPVQPLFWIIPDAILSGLCAYGYWSRGDEINTTHCKLQHGETARQPHEMTVDRKYHLSLLWRIRMWACKIVQMRLYLFPFVESVWMCLFVFLFWWQVCHFPNVITRNLFSFPFCHFHSLHLLICGTTELLMNASVLLLREIL